MKMWKLFSTMILLIIIQIISSDESSSTTVESTVPKTTQQIDYKKKNLRNSRTGGYAGKMLAPYLGAGLKLYRGISKGTSGMKTVASGTYDVASGAYDVFKISVRSLGDILLPKNVGK